MVVSFGKSGRTWLRVMMSRYYQHLYGVSESSLLTFSNYHRKHAAVPRILFTHDNYIENYAGTTEKAHFRDKRVVLLVRNPLDVAVSQYFQWLHRMKPSKKELNGYPPHGTDVGIYDFVTNPECGLPKIITFMNRWAEELPKIENLIVVRYEDLRREPEQGLSRIMDFAESRSVSEEAVREAVRYGSVENMRALERGDAYADAGSRMKPGDDGNPESFKVRRAKVGGYRDYFEPDELKTIEDMVGSRLAAVYGYAGDSAVARASSPPVASA